MTKRIKTPEGWWPRFSEYVLAEGRICPMPGASMEKYDPWREYETGKERGDPPAYLELLWIFDELRPDVKLEYDDDKIGKVLDWTRRHGLLGILVHRFEVQKDALAAVAQDIVSSGPKMLDRKLSEFADDSDARFNVRSTAGFYQVEGETPSNPHGRVSIGEASDPDCYEYFGEYCEPLEYWLEEVCLFSESIRKQNDNYLNSILAKNRIEFTIARGTPQIQNKFVSLLSALALMYAQDQMAGYRLFRCIGCGSQSQSAAYQAQFCSRTCGDRYRKRRSRERAAKAQSRTARPGTRRHSNPNSPPE